MKKNLLLLVLGFLGYVPLTYAQCVPTCSNYNVSAISHSTFPSGPTNVTPQFTNTFLGTWADDGSIGPIPIGFNFDFYCNTYTNIHICSNGFIMMDYQAFPWPTQFVHNTQNLPDAALPNGMIAFNMTDLDPGQGGTVTYTTVGTAPNRMFIVTYNDVPCFTTPSDLNTGQIVLYETSNIIDIHTTKAKPDQNQLLYGGSTQGIENTTASAFATPPGRNASTTWGANANYTAYRFAPYTPAPPTSVNGNTMLCQGTMGSYQTTPIIGALSYTWSFPSGWTGTSTTAIISPTAGASGNVSVSATYTCGTSAPATISVTSVPAPVASIQSATPAVLCSGKSVTINANGGVQYTVEPGGMVGTSPLVIQVNASTIFSIAAENSSGCISLNTPTTSIFAYPTPTITVNSGTVCNGQTYAITPSGADFYTISGGFAVVTPSLGLNNYTVTGTFTNGGCVSQPEIVQVTAIALPTVNVVTTRSVICKWESNTLTANGATSYTWSTNAISPSIVVNPTVTTNYTVTGELNSCKSSKVFTQMVNLCLGIEEETVSQSITMYPNPATANLFVRLSTVNSDAEIRIFNMAGQLIKTQTIQSALSNIDLEGIANGLYLVEIQNGSDKLAQKLVIGQ